MGLKLSTGLRNKLLDTGSLDATLNGGKIRIFAGSAPADADAAETGTLIVEVSNGGAGVNFEAAAVAGVISKLSSETWSGTNVATLTATHYRHVAAGDTGVLSTTQARIQGTVSTVGADMNLSSVALVSGATQAIDFYSVTLPAA
jgi:hypothetical protein